MDKIETLGDWNARLGCCCRMPACPLPITMAETISLTVCGFAMPEFPKMTDEQRFARYERLAISRIYHERWQWKEDNFSFGSKVSGNRKVDHDYRTGYKKSQSGGFCSTVKESSSHTGSFTETNRVEYPESSSFVTSTVVSTENWSATGGENAVAVGTRKTSVSGTNYLGESINSSASYPYSYFGLAESAFVAQCKFQGDATFRYQNTQNPDPSAFYKITINETITRKYIGLISVRNLLQAKKFPDDASLPSTLYSEHLALSGKRSRFQIVIPPDHLGTWFKVSWDWLNEPEGWNATIPDAKFTGPGTPPRIPKPGRPKRTLEPGGTWEWKGPGNPAEPEGNSWKSPWIEIPVPDFKGRKKRVNFRFECYRSPYGNKPQVSGEAIDETEL